MFNYTRLLIKTVSDKIDLFSKSSVNEYVTWYREAIFTGHSKQTNFDLHSVPTRQSPIFISLSLFSILHVFLFTYVFLLSFFGIESESLQKWLFSINSFIPWQLLDLKMAGSLFKGIERHFLTEKKVLFHTMHQSSLSRDTIKSPITPSRCHCSPPSPALPAASLPSLRWGRRGRSLRGRGRRTGWCGRWSWGSPAGRSPGRGFDVKLWFWHFFKILNFCSCIAILNPLILHFLPHLNPLFLCSKVVSR